MIKLQQLRSPFGLVGSVALLLIAASYFVLIFYSERMGLELYSGWQSSEAIEIQQGNLLAAVTKAQRSLMSSDLLAGITLIDAQSNELLISVGSPFSKKNIAPYIGIRPSIEKNGFFSFSVANLIRSQGNRAFIVRFDFRPKILSVVFWVLVACINLMMILLWWLVRRSEQIEASNREHLLLMAIGNLIEQEVLGDVLVQKLPFLVAKWTEVQQRLKKVKEYETQAVLGQKMAELAAQVSHDIRSPLSALTLMMDSLAEMPEERRILIRSAIHRVTDIANSLLDQSKAKHMSGKMDESSSGRQVTMISSLIDSLVSEKRIQIRNMGSVILEAKLESSYGLFSQIDPSELKRVLSNLINNSVEALDQKNGIVEVGVWRSENGANIVIAVKDNGAGIPKHILEKLGQKGFSYGKEGTDSGSGLGVYSTKKIIESHGGEFKVESAMGIGTTIYLILKSAPPPAWFVEKLSLPESSTLVAVDDDRSVLEIWRQRFSKMVTTNKVHLVSLSSGAELRRWLMDYPEESKNSTFLMDYELLDQKETGLDLIESLKIAGRSILVSSRYDEMPIKTRCEKSGVKLVPKGLAAFLPIEITTPKQKCDLVLIDDDSLIHSVWAMVAESKGLSVKIFSTPEEFKATADSIDRNAPIYVDVSLGDGIKGTDVAQDLKDIGFVNINLATGYDADSIQVPSFIRRVVGKDFPL